jgi:hypothetical protein
MTALDLSRYDLPATPSAGTGLYDLPVYQQITILEYTADLVRAKAAGVAGPAIKIPRPFIDGVVTARVQLAKAGDDAWRAACDQMVDERKEWRVRIADRAIRSIPRDRGIPDAGRSKAVTAVIRATAALQPALLARLTAAFDEAQREDKRLTREALPNVPDASFGALLSRAIRFFDADPGSERVRVAIEDLAAGAWHAAIAAYFGDRIETPFRAILAGPWEAVVDGKPELLTHAWSAEATEIRSDFLSLPAEAYQDPDRF